ncbi:MAG: hypothetical protein IKA36_04210 [Clostridia bacterium]|nr:hypothetical protein [Clostridia bacterium]
MKDVLPISLKDIEDKINNKQGIPDYDNAEQLSGKTHTATKAGIVFLGVSGNIIINNKQVMELKEAHAMIIPLDANDTISISSGSLQSFVPFK